MALVFGMVVAGCDADLGTLNQDGKGRVTITIGTGGGDREGSLRPSLTPGVSQDAAHPASQDALDAPQAGLYYTLEFTADGKETVTAVINGLADETSVIVELDVGEWTLTVTGYLFAADAGDPSKVVASGHITVAVVQSADGTIQPVTVSPDVISVAGLYVGLETVRTDISGLTGTGGTGILAKSLTWLHENASKDGAYTVKLDTGESLASSDLSTIINADNVTLTIKGLSASAIEADWPVVQLDETNGRLFTVGAAAGNAQNLVLDGKLILKGRSDNSIALVYVNALGTLKMEGNAKITGNTNNSNFFSGIFGGGVNITGGIFTMNDSASISGNSAEMGGGVFIWSGAFTMNDNAFMSGNNARGQGGGGVAVAHDGVFTMNGGTISGNICGSISTDMGGGVILDNLSSTFVKTGGRIAGNPTGYSGHASNVAPFGSAVAMRGFSADPITIGDTTAYYFDDDLGPDQNTPQ
jgi:hypothetical protein